MDPKITADLESATPYLQSILDGINYSIISTDINGVIKSVNAATERMLGYRANELIGKKTPTVIHDPKEIEQRAEELSKELGYFIKPGFEVFIEKAKLTGCEEREWSYIRKDKSSFPVFLSVTAIKNSENEIAGYLGVASDLSEIKKNNKYLKLQYEVTKIIAESMDYLTCLREILKTIAETMEVDFGSLWREDPERHRLICENFWCNHEAPLLQFGEKMRNLEFEIGNGLPGRIWKEREQVIIDNIQNASNFVRAPFAKEAGLKSALGFPLFYDNKCVGIFEFLSKEENYFKYSELSSFINWLGQSIGMLIMRYKMEEDLKKREEDYYQTSLRLKLATESAKIGIWDWNPATNQIIWNDMMFHVYGEKLHAVSTPYEYWLMHLHPDDKDRAASELQDAIKGKKQFNTFFRIIWSDESIHYIRAIANLIKDAQGNPSKMVGVNWDITEEKTSQNRLQMMIESSPNAIVLVNRERSIVLVNYQTEKLFGYRREELIGQKVEMLIPENFRQHHPEYVENDYKNPSMRPMGVGKELFGLKKNGENVPIEIALNPIKTLEGTLIFALVTDITEKKQTERMKNELISMVSHELRTPLTSIQGALGLIRNEETSEKKKNLIQIAYSNCERLIRLINDLLDIEKLDLNMMSFNKEMIDLKTIIKNAVDSNKNYASQFDVTVSFDQENPVLSHSSIPFSKPSDHSGELFIYADPDRIMQVLTNLISNAVKFSPKGGHIFIWTTLLGNGKVRVSIKDEGPGVPREFRNRIFQKFSQADSPNNRKKGGTGLGLSISKAIIERHDGIINYESEPDQGATFYFDLPLQQED